MFINELFAASKSLGVLEEKINSYKFDNILIPLLHKKEAISSMNIEGTQTTISDLIEDEINVDKEKDNYIINSVGTIVFNPPSFNETKKYMDELIDFINDTKIDMNPLIKNSIIHSQFESIHPFEDGNGRVGRLLISLCLYKFGVIKFPFFYISEAISQDKNIYYNKLTDTRKNDYTEWIKFFLKMCIVQVDKLIQYIDSLI